MILTIRSEGYSRPAAARNCDPNVYDPESVHVSWAGEGASGDGSYPAWLA